MLLLINKYYCIYKYVSFKYYIGSINIRRYQGNVM